MHPEDKAANLAAARAAVAEAAQAGAKLVCLPECFNSPYDSKLFPTYAEEVNEHWPMQASASKMQPDSIRLSDGEGALTWASSLAARWSSLSPALLAQAFPLLLCAETVSNAS